MAADIITTFQPGWTYFKVYQFFWGWDPKTHKGRFLHKLDGDFAEIDRNMRLREDPITTSFGLMEVQRAFPVYEPMTNPAYQAYLLVDDDL